ncbi:hypothetical protein ACGFNY_44265 [Streptomyces chartreusis]|uniref:hypothetical protein n=1 Tax=Streptomyces chartreusis TaxID=1969 RepID=UPI003715F8B5
MHDTIALRAGLAALAEAEEAQPSPVWEPVLHHEPLCGRTEAVSGETYRPCGRPAGHREAYCRSADGAAYFLAVDRSRTP